MVKVHLEPKRPITPECIEEEDGYYHSPLDRTLVHRRVIPTSFQSALIYAHGEVRHTVERGLTVNI